MHQKAGPEWRGRRRLRRTDAGEFELATYVLHLCNLLLSFQLHMACSWSMSKVVETLLEHTVDPNLADCEGKTPLHIAILNQTPAIIRLLIDYRPTDLYRTDNYGQSPFSLAVKLKSRTTAQALTTRDPHVSEQCDGKGRNYLHLALERTDYDSVLFLLDNQVNISARVQDSAKKAPIHLAAESGSEIILRTLVLAGCNVNDVTMQNQSGKLNDIYYLLYL